MGSVFPCRRSMLLLSCLSCACVGALPELRPETDIAIAVGGVDALCFRWEGEAPDAPPPGMTPAGAAARLGFADAVQRAMLTDPGLQAALARVQMARAEAEQARTLPNPVLELVWRWGSPEQFELSLAQSLLGVLQRPRRAAAADDRLRAAAEHAMVVGLDTAEAIRACYLRAQEADELLRQLEAQRVLLDQALAVMASRVEHGEAARVELDRLRAQSLRAVVEAGRALQQHRELRLQLARRIGEPSSSAAWLLDPWPVPRLPTVDGEEEAAWLHTALARRPELHALRWRLAALDDEQALAKWSPWQAAAIGANVQKAPSWVGGPVLGVPLPIFDSGDAAVAHVSAEQAEVRHLVTECMRHVIEDVRSAFAALVALRGSAALVRGELLPALELRLRQLQAAKRLGQADALAAIDVQTELLLAQGQARVLELDAALALLRLQRAAAACNPITITTLSNEER